MNRKSIDLACRNLFLRFFPIAIVSIAFSVPALAEDRPNVLFIAVDDLRPELGCYGTKAITPNIDRLAASGMRFDRAYCNQAVCGASRISLMTGLYPESTGLRSYHVNDWRKKLADVTTLNQHLKNHGYLTLGLGKIYHERVGHDAVDGDNWHRWFDLAHETHWVDPDNIAKHDRNEKRFRESGKGPKRGPVTESDDVADDAYIDGKRADLAVRLINQLGRRSDEPTARAAGVGNDGGLENSQLAPLAADIDATMLAENTPFFLAVGFTKPHLPFNAPQKYWDLYQRENFHMPPNAGIPSGYPVGAANLNPGEIKYYGDIPSDESPTQWADDLNQRLLHGYHACVSFTDAHIGRLLDALDENGLADNTIVILWGDHGWKLGDHSSWCKHTNFEVDTRVPLIIRHPKMVQKRGSRSSSLVELIDLYPTLCQLAGISLPSHLQGRSLAPILRDPSAEVRNSAYSSYPARVGNANTIGHSIRTANHRYTQWWDKNDAESVVAAVATDLSVDPGETTALADDGPLLSKLAAQLRSRVIAARTPLQREASTEDHKKEVGEFSIPDVSPLSAAQLTKLRMLVKTDPEAAALAASIQSQATPLLGTQPRPIAVIQYEGLVNTDPKRIKTVEHLNQMSEIAVLMRHWQVTADERTAETLRHLIAGWAQTYKPTGNDVNENKFHPLLVAYLALQDSFDELQRHRIDAWVEQIGELHEPAVAKSQHVTNRYSKSVRLLALTGLILERDDWAQAANEGVKRFVRKSLYADGSSRDLKHRDSLTYHGSSLKPPMELAMLAGDDGLALYSWTSPRGGSLKRSVDFMVPYAMGEKTHAEWVNTKVELDRRRAAEGIEKYRAGRLYEPTDALAVMEYASYFDPDLMQVVRHLTTGDAKRFPTWRTLINAAAQPDGKHTTESSQALTAALQEFDHEFDDCFAWWGKVYDPNSGGFFYSLSSKRSEQFGPFIEATAKAIHVLEWTGMMEQTSPKFRAGVIHYFQSRQNPATGFFYDPDYETQYSHNTLTRALGMSIGALETCGAKPLYQHPLDRIDDNAAAKEHYQHYETPETFSAWLNSLPWERRIWTVGARLRAELGVFNQLPMDKREELLSIAREFIAKRQSDNGYFVAPTDDWTSSLSGTYKIAAFLDGTGSPIPRSTEMLSTTLDHLFHSDYQNTIVLYNTVNMLNILASNGENCDVELRVKIVRRCTELLRTMHAPDGGFLTQIGKSSPSPNGFKLADNVIESNTNATGLAHKTRLLLIQFATGVEGPHTHPKSAEFLKMLPASQTR
ncbi:sulfatase-like hydrolase/transferase [Stieleria sp. TO1_6]|uniref:sulfatase-like hydrolase/transferase n=1 Tax=Stieleria tagensis TaxID=2956795 RepID=UPI00209ADD85|nr:sulfatase-like hydrolase/transferase [Stieleria tagensis]MCO8124546.1 sulfatase-like hydrolase/transferase [Stieleria tagensis]